ncbi:MAG: hypothetical protein KBI07_01155 [Candidatus Atribacteria bacterium]|nr:hypothetical protein [Candidatus Atribacteria bacterium]
MKKKESAPIFKLWLAVILVSLLLVSITNSAACAIALVGITPYLSPEEETLRLDRLKLEIAGEFFGIDSRLILDYRSKGYSSEDIIAALYFSADTKRPVNTIFELKEREKDWEKVAIKLGVSPNAHGMQMALTHGKGKKVGLKKKLNQEENIFVNLVSTYYQIEVDRLRVYIERGFSLNDILLAINLGTQQGIRFELLLQEREKGLDWFIILGERNIKTDSLFLPYRAEIRYNYRPLIE